MPTLADEILHLEPSKDIEHSTAYIHGFSDALFKAAEVGEKADRLLDLCHALLSKLEIPDFEYELVGLLVLLNHRNET